MKIISLFLFIFFAGISYAQKINGIGKIQLGKSEQDIIHDLQWSTSEISDGTKKTKEAFRKSIESAIVRVQYDTASMLIQDLRSHAEDPCTAGYEPEHDIYACADMVEYFVPGYEYDSIPLEHFILTFYMDKLIGITMQSFYYEKNIVYRFEDKYKPVYWHDHDYDGDNNDCNRIPHEEEIAWKSGIDGVDVDWLHDEWCCDYKKDPQFVSYSRFRIWNTRYDKDIFAKCLPKKKAD